MPNISTETTEGDLQVRFTLWTPHYDRIAADAQDDGRGDRLQDLAGC